MLSMPIRRKLVTMPACRAIFGTGNHIRSGEAVDEIIRTCKRNAPGQPEFVQAVEEVAEDLEVVFHRHKHYIPLFNYIVEPERLIKFKVPWIDDAGVLRMNRGFRVQFSSVLGPYKGGLRFHPGVTEGVIKFLGFEQILKNSLTTLPMGGGKGGSDFDPKGKSEAEVARFCQSFMTELSRYIGPNIDVPAGDIGVGGREIGYMFGQYKRLTSQFEGVLTGKGFNYGGSLIRPEATGYGCVFYAQEALNDLLGENFEGKRCLISGSGNVAQYTAEKILQLGGNPLTFSDSTGFIYEPEGFSSEQVQQVMQIKNEARGRCEDYLKYSNTAVYRKGERPWSVKADFAFPSATQNELNGREAKMLVENGCRGVFEGANMPSTPGAVACYQGHKMVFGPGKAANAGGVAVSGLEMSQNASMLQWGADEVEAKLQRIMQSIYKTSSEIAADYGKPGDLKFGANAAGFVKVADTLREHGL
eukprot:NODE_5428_length_1771_cov_53.272506.p1 GENE.NODE_5428_length_1771_cov_53.272506~~NODE_5428_length_1771_cov_53.272506.p1  ORF type:complete len:473 (+),score=116.88 NODE_5428_length_1771_cov_53.272506:110-1528(+)